MNPAQATQKAVLDVLAGAPLHDAARQVPMEATDLADAVDVFQQAGLAALEAQGAVRTSWFQVHIQFPNWDTAEETAATHLGPWLRQAEADGLVSSWWYIRKPPCWRLRCTPGATVTRTRMMQSTTAALDDLASRHLIAKWWETIYEPETTVFGGQPAMSIAHRLFHADSKGILDYLGHPAPTAQSERTIGRRELAVLMCSLLMRSAEQEWSEQGDVWHQVSQLRPLPSDTPPDRLRGMQPTLKRLMTVDAGSTSTLMSRSGPLAAFTPWATAVEEVGAALHNGSRTGQLDRGIREILTHHVLFHLNRMGLPDATQGILARAARETAITQ